MFFRIVLFIWEFVLDVAAVSRLTEGEKDLEILLLRQQHQQPPILVRQWRSFLLAAQYDHLLSRKRISPHGLASGRLPCPAPTTRMVKCCVSKTIGQIKGAN
jgi:hypothetical protein